MHVDSSACRICRGVASCRHGDATHRLRHCPGKELPWRAYAYVAIGDILHVDDRRLAHMGIASFSTLLASHPINVMLHSTSSRLVKRSFNEWISLQHASYKDHGNNNVSCTVLYFLLALFFLFF